MPTNEMLILHLHRKDSEEPVWVNAKWIVFLERSRGGTCIVFQNGNHMMVKEHVNLVLAQIPETL